MLFVLVDAMYKEGKRILGSPALVAAMQKRG